MDRMVTRPLSFYQELQYINTVNVFPETSVLCSQILQRLNFNFDENVNAIQNLQNGGNIAFNYIVTNLKDFDIVQSLLNHNINEQFRWMYVNCDDFTINKKSIIFHSTMKACIIDAENHKSRDYTIDNNSILIIHSICECASISPWFVTYNHMCGSCINSWSPANRIIESSSTHKYILLPELFQTFPNKTQNEDYVSYKFVRNKGIYNVDSLSRKL